MCEPDWYVLHAVHVAVDFQRTGLKWHIVQNYRHRHHQSQQVGETSYAKRDVKARRNICIYDDRLSKVTREPCDHIEFRFRGADACRRAGLTLTSLIDGPDLMALLNRQARIMVIKPAIIEQYARNTARRSNHHTVNDLIPKVRSMLSRSMTAQEMRDRPKRRNWLQSVPWDEITSGPQWHSWSKSLIDIPHNYLPSPQPIEVIEPQSALFVFT